jgi:ubiquinone/menaquinone biosynthesis C-methylase UbiE
MYSKAMIDNYKLVEKVYGNYIEFQRKLTPEILKYKSENSPIEILEVGSGTGITTNIILTSREDIKLTSIDIDKKMIKKSKDYLRHYDNLELINSDALRFIKGSGSNHYDLIISAFTIHNQTIEYRKDLYYEIYRILKTDGLFLNADKFVSDSFEVQIDSFKYRISSYIEVLLREGQYELLKEWIVHYIEDIKPNKIMKLDEERDTIQNCDFRDSKYLFKSEKEMLAIIGAKK